MFSVPSSVHWMARHYRAPFLQVVYNNRGWKAPKFSALAVHPTAYASRADEIDVSFDPRPTMPVSRRRRGRMGANVKQAGEVQAAVREGLRVVREEKRAAVLDVWLPRL